MPATPFFIRVGDIYADSCGNLVRVTQAEWDEDEDMYWMGGLYIKGQAVGQKATFSWRGECVEYAPLHADVVVGGGSVSAYDLIEHIRFT
jgi:hypothetical protein